MKKHNHNKGPQVCQECNKVFINLRSHIQQVHERLRRYICPTCDKTFGKKSGLNRHIQTVHEKIKNFLCDLCERSFGEKIQMQRHRKIHFKEVNQEPDFFDDSMKDEEIVEDKKRFICGICKKKVNSKSILKRHKMIVHEKKRPWLCDLCPKSYGEKSNLMRHISKAHLGEDQIIIEKLDEAEVDEIFECKSCGRNLSTQWGLRMHEKECQIGSQIKLNDANSFHVLNNEEVLPNNAIIYEENDVIEALEEANEENIIEEEQITESELKNYPEEVLSSFICQSCNISFKAKRYYLQHLKSFHTDAFKKIKCNYCDQIFTHRCQKLRHIRKIHPEVFEDDSRTSGNFCEICSKAFKTEKFLQIHNSMHHKTQTFECPICNKLFTFKHSLDRHMNAVHEDKRDFKCEVENCERAFRSKYELNQHRNKIHQEMKNFEQISCDVCDKICSSRKNLYAHKKYVHEGIRWGSGEFKCKFCLEVFDSKYKKSKHWYQVHWNGELKFRTCHYCNADFQLHDEFKNHIETHSEIFVCKTCGYYFLEASALLVHEESHRQIDEKLRQFVCDVCSHRLSTKGQLEVHMKRHFDDRDQFVCDVSLI